MPGPPPPLAEGERVAAGAPPSRVVATAGHVDHGKSTLVQWLTGTNPDRLEEERRRGLTIDLGFAATVLGDIEVGFVDVPGHVRFLKNMLAGVGATDACLFVVSAVEGWKPQTEDHLRILDLFGLRHGVVALTHAATLDDDLVELVADEVAERVAGTFLAAAPVVAVDVPAGLGTDGPGGLRAALAQLVAGLPPAADRGRPRLWVDRSFVIRGAGTVVTGTLAGGTVSVGDHLVATRGRDNALEARVRGLETYGHRVAQADPGRRLAVNLAGTDHDEVGRGAALVRDGQWHRASAVDASLTVLPGAHPVSHRGAYLAYFGTDEQAVRLRVIGAPSVEPGEVGPVRLWLTDPLVLVPGDRFVLRDAGRRTLVGGGEVLTVEPVLAVKHAAPDKNPARMVAERGWVEAAVLARLSGGEVTANLARWVVDPGALDAARTRVLELVAAAGAAGLDLSMLDERTRAVADSLPGLQASHGIARIGPAEPGPAGAAAPTGVGGPSGDPELEGHPYLAALRAAPFTPPPPDGVDRHDLRRLVRSGLVVESGGVWFAASALDDAAARVAHMLAEAPEGVRVSDIRDELGASRKYILPLLAHFDNNGITRRRGELRIGGPRLPSPTAHTRSDP